VDSGSTLASTVHVSSFPPSPRFIASTLGTVPYVLAPLTVVLLEEWIAFEFVVFLLWDYKLY
jgi:hypothetical protein